MALKDLSAFLVPDLELQWRDRTFVVPPPTKDVGLKLAAVHAAGMAAYLSLADACPSCGRSGAPDELPQATKDLVEAVADKDLGELSLGAAYDEMQEAGVPGPHIDQFALYALYYWVLGEASADELIKQASGGDASGEARTPSSGSSTSTPGRRTGSGSQTQRRASSRGTGGSRKR